MCVKLFREHSWPPCFSSCRFFPPINASAAAAEMSVRMSNLDNERDDRDEDSHEDRGISEYSFCQAAPPPHPPHPADDRLVNAAVFPPLPVSNTRFIAAVIERHTHTPERRRRYWGRSGTESDHGRTARRRTDEANQGLPPPPPQQQQQR